MKRNKYRHLLKQVRKRVFLATIQAQDGAEPHLEEITVVSYKDIIDILYKNLKKGRKRK